MQRVFTSGGLPDNVTLAKSSGKLKIKDGGVGTNQLQDVSVTDIKIANNAISQAKLKTAVGEVSASYTGQELVLPGGSYGFYPQVKMSVSTNAIWLGMIFGRAAENNNGVTSYTTTINLGVPLSGETMYAQQRYISSTSPDYWVYILWDKIAKEIKAAWSAPDHPSHNQGADEGVIKHPFIKYFSAPLPSNLEIILIDNAILYDNIFPNVTRTKSILEFINTEYMIDEISRPTFSPRIIQEIDEFGDMTGEVLRTYTRPNWFKKFGFEFRRVEKETFTLKRKIISSLPADVKFRKLKLRV